MPMSSSREKPVMAQKAGFIPQRVAGVVLSGALTYAFTMVPDYNYNASHGCVRNPIVFSRFIYNWVQIGMPIYVYG